MDSKLEFMVDTLDNNLMDFSLHGGNMLNIGEPYDTDPDGCSAVLYAPFIRNLVENRAFSLYAMECEGDIPTRLGKINNIINLMVAAGPECNNFEVQCAIYDAVGFDSDTLTNQEVKYIEEEVAKRL